MTKESSNQQVQTALKWYDDLRPLRVDLVGEFAGSELFIVEGDSMLRWVWADQRIDFNAGFQLLHAVFVVERFLASLRQRKCQFDVVFFDEHKEACIPAIPAASDNAAKYLLARATVIRHLQFCKLDGEPFLHMFKNLQDPRFEGYMDEYHPYFALCHDGAEIGGLAVQNEETGAKEEMPSITDQEERTMLLLKRMIATFMEVHGLNVALINNMAIVDSKIMTNVIETSHEYNKLLDESSAQPSADANGQYDGEAPSLSDAVSALMSERERLAVSAVSKVLKDSPTTAKQASIFLLHVALLKHLLLTDRHLLLDSVVESSQAKELSQFVEQVLKASIGSLNHPNSMINDCTIHDIHDYIDGRLLLVLLKDDIKVPAKAMADFERLATAVKEQCGIALESPKGTGEWPSSHKIHEEDATIEQGVLPFSNPVIDEYLASIHIDQEEDPEDENNELVLGKTYREVQQKEKEVYTGTAKKEKKPVLTGHRLAKKGRVQAESAAKWAAMKQKRAEQRYFAQMNRYAASLTDSIGGRLEPKLIINDPASTSSAKQTSAKQTKQKPEKTKPDKKAPAADGGRKENPKDKKAKPAKISNAEAVKLANAEKLAAKEAKSVQMLWNAVCAEIARSSNDDMNLQRLDTFLQKLRDKIPSNAPETHEGHYIEVEARCFKVFILQRVWCGYCERGEKERGYAVAALLFDQARRTLTRPGLTKNTLQIIQNAITDLGIALPPFKAPGTLVKRDLSRSMPAKWTGKAPRECKVGMTSEEFQLLHCGELMDRDMDSQPDSRVGFNPDAWQRKVLDQLDSGNSVFVVAPTSAGKTFISFYAMEQALRSNDDSVLVYIAPTKALVNQIAAEVIARFRKNYQHAGKTVWAIHSGDYSMNNPKKCQILITVPSILQSMLLSPSNANIWAPRIKRIIFDEVHSIGSAEDGLIWEQLLLLAPCPIIALSATVGNPDEFSSWLEASQKRLGIDMTMVRHPHRYSDLRKFVYLGPPSSAMDGHFKGLVKPEQFAELENIAELRRIHPVSALLDVVHTHIPPDLVLEPRDCLELYLAMKKFETPEYTVPKEIDYRNFFGQNGQVIKKAQVLQWEVVLKEVLQKWMQDTKSPFSKVVHELANVGGNKTVNDKLAALKSKTMNDYLMETTLPLLSALNSTAALPAILFSYDRVTCEQLCEALNSQLEAAEKEWRESDPKWKAKLKDWKAYQEQKAYIAGKRSTGKGSKEDTKADRMRDEAEAEMNSLEFFDPEEPSIEFSFADPRKHSKEELKQDIETLSWGRNKQPLPDFFINALKRGVGVHHAGLSRKYRQSVEMLFRKGFLRVVIATGTLALGINMPCRTVVFAGDSVYLTALNYRQASGRAGRRGFDNIGNVVFHGIPMHKINRLISSKLPSLAGHFPISQSLILRLFYLLHSSGYSEHAKRLISNLLNQPRLVLGGVAFKEQVLHHLRFSIEYLRRQRLLSADGTPLNFAGLISHLYQHESSAFALHAFLFSGYLREVCANVEEKPQTTAMELMILIANLFGRQPVIGKPGFECLPPLPPKALKEISKQNDETLRTYTAYALSFAKQYCKEPDEKLPFSGLRCGGDGISQSETGTPSAHARSSFFGLSGHADKFSSVQDLASSVRDGVFVEGASIPYLPTEDVKLNPWLLEFYRHGDTDKLEKVYKIPKSEVWYMLKDVSIVLATIVMGLTVFLKNGPGAYFDPPEGKDEDGEEIAFEVDDGESDTEDASSEVGSSIVPDIDGVAPLAAKKEVGDFVKVLQAFRALRLEFETKFQAIYA